MYIQPKEIVLKNGQRVVLKSPGVFDAGQLLEHMRITSGETEFMSRYPEEIMIPVEQQARYLQMIENDADNFMLAAYIDGKMVGNAGVTRVRDNIKYRHRATFGISLQEKVCGLGLGTTMMAEVIRYASSTKVEQLELTVFEENLRARNLYEKFGFRQVGMVPNAYRLKDGTYHNEIQMVRPLRERKGI